MAGEKAWGKADIYEENRKSILRLGREASKRTHAWANTQDWMIKSDWHKLVIFPKIRLYK